MLKKQKVIYATLFIIMLLASSVKAQFGIGLAAKWDLYHRITNPSDDLAYTSAGSAILNLGLGPKIWLGHPKMSLSVEAIPSIGFLGLAIKDYKGLGTASLPILACLNIKGVSGLDPEGRTGMSIGGGIDYSRTELYGLDPDYKRQGVSRGWNKTYLVHAGYGFGLQGFGLQGFGRYGFNPDNDASTFSVGILWDFNFLRLRKIKNKASEL